jgi:hypothetical protein
MNRVVYLKGIKYKLTEDDEKYIFTEVSDRKLKVNFSFSKKKEDNELAEYGLKVFWTEVYKDILG